MELPPARQRLLVDDLPRWATAAGTPRRTAGLSSGRRPPRGRSPSSSRRSSPGTGIYAGIQVRKGVRERMPDGREITHREQYVLHFEEGRTVKQVWLDAGRNCFWVPIRKIESRPYDGWVYNLEMAERPERLPGARLRRPQLHGPDLRHRLASCRGRRGHRPAGLEGPLHDHPELVERRLQPRHEAGPRVRELHGRVDRREYRARA